MNDNQTHEELLMLIRHSWEDIDRTKQQQWRDLYNLLITQGTIIGLFVVTAQSRPSWLYNVFLTAVVLLIVIGIWIVKASQDTLTQQRNLIESYYGQLHLRNLLTGPPAESVHRSTYPTLYSIMLIGVGLFALLVIIGLG